MKASQIILLAAAVFLFVMGAWPLAFIPLTAYIVLTAIKMSKQESEKIAELEKRIADLEKEQMVNRVLRESEGKKKD